MEPRKAVGWLSAVVIAIGFILLLVPVSTGAGTGCGSVFNPSGAAAFAEEISHAASGFGEAGASEACGSRRSVQAGIGWAVLGLGALVGGYLVLTNSAADRPAAAAGEPGVVDQ